MCGIFRIPSSVSPRRVRRLPRILRRLACLRVPAIHLRGREVIAILFTLGVIAIGTAFTLWVTADGIGVEIARAR